jgi:hypothetical protein
MMNGDTVPQLHAQVAARAVAGQMLIVLADRGEVMVLNDTGTRLWAWIDGIRSVREIVGALAETYKIEVGQAEADTRGFLESLWAVQAVEWRMCVAP